MNEKIGRNAACPCGSGKKFKKCCGFDIPSDSDSILDPLPEGIKTGTPLDIYIEVFRGIMLYMEELKSSVEFGSTLRQIWSDWNHRYKPGQEKGLNDSFVMNWFALDNRFGVDQRTAVERMMEESEFRGLDSEVQAVIRAMSDSYPACYQVKEQRKDVILFEELVTGRRWTVYRVGDSSEDDALPGVIWHTRFVGPQSEACYFGQPVIFGPEAAPDFIKIITGQIAVFKEYASTRSLKFEIPRDAFKVANSFWAEYLYRGIAGKAPDLSVDEERAVRTIVTTDGEKIRLSTVILKILQLDGLREKLSKMDGIEYDEQEKCWVWFKSGNRKVKSLKRTLLGRIVIRDNDLVGEVSSLERALRLKNKLSFGLGKRVEFDRIDSKDLAAMPPPSEEEQRKFEEDQRHLHANPEIRKALLEKQEDYYFTVWIKSKIPALDNKTPLQAVKTMEGRLQLEALINHMDGMNRASPDYLPKVDMNLLRQKLGLPLRSEGKAL